MEKRPFSPYGDAVCPLLATSRCTTLPLPLRFLFVLMTLLSWRWLAERNGRGTGWVARCCFSVARQRSFAHMLVTDSCLLAGRAGAL
jgi:hypothetical protein